LQVVKRHALAGVLADGVVAHAVANTNNHGGSTTSVEVRLF
jgi:hypothetical protein